MLELNIFAVKNAIIKNKKQNGLAQIFFHYFKLLFINLSIPCYLRLFKKSLIGGYSSEVYENNRTLNSLTHSELSWLLLAISGIDMFEKL